MGNFIADYLFAFGGFGLTLNDMSKPPKDSRPTSSFDKEKLAAYIKDADRPLTRRDIVRAFDLKDSARIALKRMLKELAADGIVEYTAAKTYVAIDGETDTPQVMVLRVSHISLDGDVFAEAVEDEHARVLAAPVVVEPAREGIKAPEEGEKFLARLIAREDGSVRAKVIRTLGMGRNRLVLGRIARAGRDLILEPVDRREREEFALAVPPDKLEQAQPGLLAEAMVEESRLLNRPRAKLMSIVGRDDDPRAISLIAIHEHGLRIDFPKDVEEETQGMKVPPPGKREDLRNIPLVTIDGADARDFDDAVFAEKLDDGGFHLIVAIADVSYYVRPGSALDREAYRRGNSTYFPDRVVPMLPEALSNDLCSLRPKEPRACLGFHLFIDEHGNLKSHKLFRGLMLSQARLTYEQVQAAYDGVTDAATDPLMDGVIRPLYDAYRVLAKAREKRGALDIDMPERQIIVDKAGNMTGVKRRARYDAHKLIEEFMILANVAAAETLEARKAPCVYRIHDRPETSRLDSARMFLDGFGLTIPKGNVTSPDMLNGILRKVEGKDFAPLVNQIILRSQCQAVYSPDNIGHFGLALKKYAHFTSPIRRYADLLVHRSLIRAYDLGEGGLPDEQAIRMPEMAESISKTERTSMEAERSSVDRFTAAYLSTRIGDTFEGRISGVTRFGLFVSLSETGADGLVPIRTLPGDFYVHDEERHALIGRRTGRLYRLCAPVTVRIREADRLTGSSLFELMDAERGAEVPGFKDPRPYTPSQARHGRGGHKGGGREGSGRSGSGDRNGKPRPDFPRGKGGGKKGRFKGRS